MFLFDIVTVLLKQSDWDYWGSLNIQKQIRSYFLTVLVILMKQTLESNSKTSTLFAVILNNQYVLCTMLNNDPTNAFKLLTIHITIAIIVLKLVQPK